MLPKTFDQTVVVKVDQYCCLKKVCSSGLLDETCEKYIKICNISNCGLADKET